MTLHSHCLGHDSVPGQGPRIPQAMRLSQKKKKTTLELENGLLASIDASAVAQGNNISTIAGETGYLVFNDTIHPTKISVMRKNHVLEKEIEVPMEITGFEYEFMACREAIMNGWPETPQMPHDEIILVMDLMDKLRRDWGVKF